MYIKEKGTFMKYFKKKRTLENNKVSAFLIENNEEVLTLPNIQLVIYNKYKKPISKSNKQ